MNEQTLMQQQLRQAAPVRSVDEEARTVEVVFSTGAVVPHFMNTPEGWRQVRTRVRIEDAALRLDRLNAGAAVLDGHHEFSSGDVIGVVEKAWVADGKALATLRFSAAPEVEPIWQKIVEGVLRNVSMGFYVHRATIEWVQGTDDEKDEVWWLDDVEPFEISMVAVGADPGAQVQKAAEQSAAMVIDKREEIDMSKTQQAPAPSQPDSAAAQQTESQATPAGNDTATLTQAATPNMEDAVRAERARISGIRQSGTTLGLDEAEITKAIDDGVALDAFRQHAIDLVAQRGGVTTDGAATVTQTASVGGPRAVVTEDGTDRFRQGAMEGLMIRAGLSTDKANEFTSLSLAELVRQSLALAGDSRTFRSRTEMVGQAFVQSGGMHSTSDFANVLSNVMHKSALMGWEEAEESFELWTSEGTLTDFRAAKRVGTGVFSSLAKKEEGADYQAGTFGDRGESIVLATYGRLLNITREAIINDDLSLLTDAPRKMGRAARRTIGNLCYDVLTSNPTMSDGTALFHADHGNLAASGAAPSVTTLGAARAAMRVQKEGDAKALNITPQYLLVPAALETTANVLMNSVVDPTANKGHAPNPVSGMAEVITDARLDADSVTAWYLAANPSMHDTVEVAYLDGIKEPYLDQQERWSTDGAQMKVRIDAGVAPMDHRTFYKNAGA